MEKISYGRDEEFGRESDFRSQLPPRPKKALGEQTNTFRDEKKALARCHAHCMGRPWIQVCVNGSISQAVDSIQNLAGNAQV